MRGCPRCGQYVPMMEVCLSAHPDEWVHEACCPEHHPDLQPIVQGGLLPRDEPEIDA